MDPGRIKMKVEDLKNSVTQELAWHALDGMEGVYDIDMEVDEGTIRVSFDHTEIADDTLLQAVIKAGCKAKMIG